MNHSALPFMILYSLHGVGLCVCVCVCVPSPGQRFWPRDTAPTLNDESK